MVWPRRAAFRLTHPPESDSPPDVCPADGNWIPRALSARWALGLKRELDPSHGKAPTALDCMRDPFRRPQDPSRSD
jgi:hypothetical protein